MAVDSSLPCSILIVDDDAAITRLLSAILRTDGFKVFRSLAPRDGLDVLDREQPDMIILDLMMPEIDGRAFYGLARARGFLGPILICSASGARAAQLELGAQGAISKPFEPEDVLASVREVFAA